MSHTRCIGKSQHVLLSPIARRGLSHSYINKASNTAGDRNFVSDPLHHYHSLSIWLQCKWYQRLHDGVESLHISHHHPHPPSRPLPLSLPRRWPSHQRSACLIFWACAAFLFHPYCLILWSLSPPLPILLCHELTIWLVSRERERILCIIALTWILI